MTQHPLAVALALLFTTSVPLSGCNPTSTLTEQEHIQRAKDFEDKGDLKGSIVELKNAIQKTPDSPQARLLLGQIYLKVGMGAEAEKELIRAEKLGVKPETIKLQLGEALLLMGEYQRVLEEINPSEQTSRAGLARIQQLRADALLKSGKTSEACALYQQSLETDNSHPPTYWGLARCAVAEGDTKKAREWLDAALKIQNKQAKTWIFVGSLKQLDKDLQGAMAAYSNALKLEPQNPEALQSRATLSISLGQWESAKQDIEKIRKLAPQSPVVHYLQALFNFRQNKFPEARDELQEVFKSNSNHMPSVLLFGETAYALGSYQQAESYLNRFLAQYPGDRQGRRFLAATQIKLNQPARALEILAPLLMPAPRDSLTLAIASEAYRTMGQPTKAAELLEKAAQIDPKNAMIQTQLGLTHLVAGDTHRAINELEEATVLGTRQYTADNLLVLSHMERKEYDKALTAIDAMEKKLPGSPATHNLRGKAYFGKNDLANARKSFERALTIDPAYFPSAASLAQLDLRDKRPDAARKRFEDVLKKDQNNLPAMLALAELAALNKQEKDYLDWLNKAIASHPKATPPRAALASHYMARNDPRKALAIATDAVTANPDDPSALGLLGTVQLAVKDNAAALTTFTQLTKKAPQLADGHYHLALAQFAANNLKAARSSLERALQLKPAHLQSKDALLRLEMAEKHPDAALAIARQIQSLEPSFPLGFEREGDIQLAQKNAPQAVKAYEAALAKGSGSAGIVKLHQAYVLAGNASTAEQLLAKWLAQHPQDSIVLKYSAEHHMRNGRNKEAIAQFQRALQLLPQDPSILNDLAILYQAEKDNRARTTAEQALKLAPDSPFVQDTLGWILVEQGQSSRGLELLRKALARAPKSAPIRYHHAVALARSGNKAQARKELEQLLKDVPDFRERADALTLLRTL